MSGLFDKTSTIHSDIITDEELKELINDIFDMDTSNKKDETIEFKTHFGIFHLDKEQYEKNKKFYEERQINAIKELSKYVTT